jgi:hypothetical protein
MKVKRCIVSVSLKRLACIIIYYRLYLLYLLLPFFWQIDDACCLSRDVIFNAVAQCHMWRHFGSIFSFFSSVLSSFYEALINANRRKGRKKIAKQASPVKLDFFHLFVSNNIIVTETNYISNFKNVLHSTLMKNWCSAADSIFPVLLHLLLFWVIYLTFVLYRSQVSLVSFSNEIRI